MPLEENKITRKSHYLVNIMVFVGLLAMIKSTQAEDWPKQPRSPILKTIPTIFNEPPYGEGRKFLLPSSALFFKKAIHLEMYNKDKRSLQELIRNKDVVELHRSRELIAKENITSFRGRVFDRQLGDGYIVMRSIF